MALSGSHFRIILIPTYCGSLITEAKGFELKLIDVFEFHEVDIVIFSLSRCLKWLSLSNCLLCGKDFTYIILNLKTIFGVVSTPIFISEVSEPQRG